MKSIWQHIAALLMEAHASVKSGRIRLPALAQRARNNHRQDLLGLV